MNVSLTATNCSLHVFCKALNAAVYSMHRQPLQKQSWRAVFTVGAACAALFGFEMRGVGVAVLVTVDTFQNPTTSESLKTSLQGS